MRHLAPSGDPQAATRRNPAGGCGESRHLGGAVVAPRLGPVLRTLAIENYRSLRSIVLELGELTVVTGANGSGKSSVYRALRLLAAVARNGTAAALAPEGGMPSVLSATPRSRGWSRCTSGSHRDDFGYADRLGAAADGGHPDVRARPGGEGRGGRSGPLLRPAALLVDRHRPAVRIRDEHGAWQHHELGIQPFDSMLSQLADPRLAPELLTLRDRMRAWRFYDHLAHR